MLIWNNKIYKNIIKIEHYNFKNNITYEWLFLGNISNDIQIIIEKLNNLGINYKKLLVNEKNKLKEIYGDNIEDTLKNKLSKNTEIIFEDIHFDDNILDIKKKISVYLSNSKITFNLNNQYIWIKHNIDKYFYSNFFKNIFVNKKILSTADILLNLKKVIDQDIKLIKKKYNVYELINELLYSKITYYKLPLNISFINKTNNNLLCEYADISKNNDEDNIFNERIVNNDYNLLNNYKFDNILYLYHQEDFENYSNKDNVEYIIERYWPINKYTNFNKNDTITVFNEINKKYNNIYENNFEKLNIENTINGFI